jgi:hypothetical protein
MEYLEEFLPLSSILCLIMSLCPKSAFALRKGLSVACNPFGGWAWGGCSFFCCHLYFVNCRGLPRRASCSMCYLWII